MPSGAWMYTHVYTHSDGPKPMQQLLPSASHAECGPAHKAEKMKAIVGSHEHQLPAQTPHLGQQRWQQQQLVSWWVP